MTMRTELAEAKYQEARLLNQLKPLREEPAINEWDHWRLIENRFPHDLHNTRHHLLVSKAPRAQFWNLSAPALKELQEILRNLNGQYDVVKYNFPAIQSVPQVCHLHLMNLKEEYR